MTRIQRALRRIRRGSIKPQTQLVESAHQRMDRFIEAIEKESFGKCPVSPILMFSGKLRHAIRAFVRVRLMRVGEGSDTLIERVEVFKLDRWTQAEVEYALMVCRKLGYTPTWD